MSADRTIFAANYHVIIEGIVAALVLLYLVYRRPRAVIVCWGVACGVMVIVAYIASQIGAAIYNDPRPFAVDHYQAIA